MKKGSKPPEERRKELIDTAIRLFSEKGYESVSVRDILAEVGWAPSDVLYFFFEKNTTIISSQSRTFILPLWRNI